MVIGAVVAIALVSGIAYALNGSPKPKTTVASSPSSETSSEIKIPAGEVSRVDLPTSFSAGDQTVDADWGWQGGAMVTRARREKSKKTPTNYFAVWTPQLKDQVAECAFSPVKNGEKMAQEYISIEATYGDKPAVFAIYTVFEKAKGNAPETLHLYAQELELPSCKAKPRINLQTEADEGKDNLEAYEYRILSSTEKSIAIAKTWGEDTLPGKWHAEIMSITGGQKKATLLQKASAAPSELEVGGSIINDIYAISTDKRRYYSIDDNKLLFELPKVFNIGNTRCVSRDGNSGLDILKISADQYLYLCPPHGGLHGTSGLGAAALITASNANLTPLSSVLKVDTENPENATMAYQQLKDGSLLITCVSSHQVFYMDTDGKINEILHDSEHSLEEDSGGQFVFLNYLENQFYIQSEEESSIMDLTGKSVKNLQTLPLFPNVVADSTKMNWIAWKTEERELADTVVLTTGDLPDEFGSTE